MRECSWAALGARQGEIAALKRAEHTDTQRHGHTDTHTDMNIDTQEAYNLVRDDATEVNWVTFKYNGSTIVPGDQGVDYETFKRKCTDDVRLFGFVRFTTGDAMSKRVKFALITWIGEDVSGLQRAKTGTDKTLVKEVVQNFAKEFVISDHKELDEDYIKNELKKAGGANYDAQTE
ncbi:coactosin-like protein [Manacus vitellinus]|uniref:coactosin-like protein n=1 Tax=Manacus vitellinus TaxID=328815 RepID=UPI00115F5120|nr:coactosin-like protein [Manacus vitellinus]